MTNRTFGAVATRDSVIQASRDRGSKELRDRPAPRRVLRDSALHSAFEQMHEEAQHQASLMAEQDTVQLQAAREQAAARKRALARHEAKRQQEAARREAAAAMLERPSGGGSLPARPEDSDQPLPQRPPPLPQGPRPHWAERVEGAKPHG